MYKCKYLNVTCSRPLVPVVVQRSSDWEKEKSSTRSQSVVLRCSCANKEHADRRREQSDVEMNFLANHR